MAQFLVYPTGGNPLSGKIFNDETLTGLTAATNYTIHKLSTAGTFTTTATAATMTNILGQLDGAGAALPAAFGATLTAMTATARSDTDGYAAALRAAHIPTGAFVIGAEVSKTVTSGNVSINLRQLGGTDTTYTLRYGSSFGLLAATGLAAGEYGLLDMGETYRLWIKKSAVVTGTTRFMFNINQDGGTQSWRRAFLCAGTNEALPWAAVA